MSSTAMADSNGGQNDLRSKIMAIMRDTTLSDDDKAKKRQALMTGGQWGKPAEEAEEQKDGKGGWVTLAAGVQCCPPLTSPDLGPG